MKRCSTLLIIREMHLKTTMRYDLTLVVTDILKKSTNKKCWSVEKRESSYTVDGNVIWCSHYGKQYGGSSKKLKIELSYDPPILCMGMYLNKTLLTRKDTCTSMFTAALFTIVKTQKERKSPSTDEQIKKMWCVFIYTHTHIHTYTYTLASLVAQMVKNLPPIQETRKDLLEREWLPTPVFLPGESHGQSSLVGHSLWLQRVGHD